jgi:TolA-binding protein
MRRRRTRECLLGLAALAGGSVVFATGVRAEDAHSLEADIRDLETATQRVAAEPLRRQDLLSPTHVEERLTDGELFYRLKDYVRASIILTDVVDNYPNHGAVPDALYLLGESLFSAGDALGARTRLRQLIAKADQAAYRPYASRALGRLIEIAIRTRDFDGVEGYFDRLKQLPPQEVAAATAYFRAKYLYNKAVAFEDVTRGGTALNTGGIDVAGLAEARTAFESVTEASPYYPQARYFIGVSYTLERKFPQAVTAFQAVQKSKATSPEHDDVLELSLLALGRLFYETDQLQQAVETYQTVPRTSKWFDTALFEIAWVYIRMGDSTRAERALEVLTIASPESRYIADGSLLRGNLLLRNGKLEPASEVFQKASVTYGPIRDKLQKIIADHADTRAYFAGLVKENIDVFDPATILPAEAVPYAEEEPDMKRALHVLGDLAQARDLVADTAQLIQRLSDAITAPNPVAVFPDMRRLRERTTAIRNGSAVARGNLLGVAVSKSGAAGSDLLALRDERRKLEASLGTLPRTDEAFIERNEELVGGFRGLSKQLSELDVQLLGMDARITATERFLLDTQDARANPDGVHAMESELGTQRSAVVGFREQVGSLKLALEAARISVGVGDPRYQRDDDLRKRFNDLAERERGMLGVRDAKLDSLFQRVGALEMAVATRDAQIDSAVAERVTQMRGEIDTESAKIEGYRAQLGQLETDAEDVVGGVTFNNFLAVKERFYDLVLRSDVGTIDVSWADREEHRRRVEILTRERSREIQSLDDEFKEIMDDRKGDQQ